MGNKVSRFSITKLKGENKISKENADKVIREVCLRFDIDIDADYDVSDASGKRTESMLSNIEDYMMRGIIEIDTGSLIITHHLQDNYSESLKNLEYHPVDGEIMSAMDGIDKNDRVAMMFAVLGKSSGQGENVIKKLRGIDLKAAQVVLDFFM